MKYQDLLDELKSLQGLLVLKNQGMAEEELNLKWLTIQEGVSSKKKKELSGRNANLLQQKVLFKNHSHLRMLCKITFSLLDVLMC